jgi:hypothetical protein
VITARRVQWFSALVTFAFVLLSSNQACAQVAGGTFTGTVTDSSGSVIPNAQIAVKNTATGITVTTTTNGAGLYVASNLAPASYQITVSASGFSTLVRTGVTLTVGAQEELNLTLTVGQVTQQVNVTGEAPAVELASSELSGTVQPTTIVELPLNGRDWASLANLQPGVAQVRPHELVTQPGSTNRGLGMQVTVDGMRPTQNVYRWNGVIMNDFSNAGPGDVLGYNLGVDAIQEFSVLTSNYSAEYGDTSGGVINAITRSGTNQFHGSGFEFLRNSAFDANNFFTNSAGLPKPEFQRNQFGGSAGGPIIKDKIFIFGNVEALRQNKDIPTQAFVPSPALLAGIINFTPGSTFPAGCVATGVPNQCSVTVNPEISKILTAFYPLPNAGLVGPTNNSGLYAFPNLQRITDLYATTRADFKLSQKDSLNASWFRDWSNWTRPDSLNTTESETPIGQQTASLEETHIFNTAWVNTLRGGYDRSYNLTGIGAVINSATVDPSFGITPNLMLPSIAGVSGGNGAAGLTPISGFAGSIPADHGYVIMQDFQLYDDASHVIGRHNLKFGFMAMGYQDDLLELGGVLQGTTSFKSLANLLQDITNKVQSPSVAPFVHTTYPHDTRAKVFAGYVQDDWRMRPSLTVNVGLRYEVETKPYETGGQTMTMPTLFTNPGACSVIDNNHNFANCSSLNNFYFSSNPTKKNFEPRIGFAWDPFHDGKTAVRGGFGLFDVLPLPYMLVLNSVQTAPFAGRTVLNSPTTGLFPTGLAPVLLSCTTCVAPNFTKTWNYTDPNHPRNYVEEWHFDIQRQFTPSLSLTVAYAGSRAIHNPFQSDDFNTVYPYKTSAGYLFPNPVGSGCLPGPPDCTATGALLGLPASFNANPTKLVPGLLINPNVAEIQTTAWESASWYNSLQVNVQKKLSHGLQVQGMFTWSKTLDTSSGSFAGDNFGNDSTPVIPWWDRSLIKGPSDFNVGRNMVINVLWQIPTPKSFAGPAGWIARGWTISGIFSASDGVPMWPLSTQGDLMGQLNAAPMAIPDWGPGCNPKNAVNPGNSQYLKASCFINPTAPSLAFYNAPEPLGCDHSFAYPTCINLMGNVGRNSITGPGLVELDTSLLKDNHIRENLDIQFRAEFFNVTNRTNFADVDPGAMSPFDGNGNPAPGFGQVTATQTDEREIQFAVKVIW